MIGQECASLREGRDWRAGYEFPSPEAQYL
jgi:hypothetical protein